jgi:hypothetical protein
VVCVSNHTTPHNRPIKPMLSKHDQFINTSCTSPHRTRTARSVPRVIWSSFTYHWNKGTLRLRPCRRTTSCRPTYPHSVNILYCRRSFPISRFAPQPD